MTGLSLWEMEKMTCGEVTEVILSRRERDRKAAQTQAVIAYQQAGLIAKAVLEGKLPEVWEVFPFWNEEEKNELKMEKYRRIMEKHAGGKKAVKVSE